MLVVVAAAAGLDAVNSAAVAVVSVVRAVVVVNVFSLHSRKCHPTCNLCSIAEMCSIAEIKSTCTSDFLCH